jgi:hypothetical protein
LNMTWLFAVMSTKLPGIDPACGVVERTVGWAFDGGVG